MEAAYAALQAQHARNGARLAEVEQGLRTYDVLRAVYPVLSAVAFAAFAWVL